MSIHGAQINQEGELEDVIRLFDLPDDILFHIFMHMDLFELNTVRQTCHFLNHFCRSSQLLNALSHQELRQIIDLTQDKLGFEGEELEDVMNMVWGDSYYETYMLTWQEYARELDCLLPQPSLDEVSKDGMRNFINRFEHVNPLNFVELNILILLCNRNLATAGSSIHYTDTNQGGFDFSNLGLTRLPVHFFMRLANIQQPLTSIDLSHNHIKYLPKSLEKCLDLWLVELNDNEIEIIPEYFPKLPELANFYIKENRISDFSPTVNQWLKEVCSESWSDLLESQKNKKEEQRAIWLKFFKYLILPVFLELLLIQGYIMANPEEEIDSSKLNQLPFVESVGFLFTFSRICLILNVLIPHLYNSLNLVYKKNLTDSFTISSKISIPNDSADAQSYELGRQSQRSWLTYFKSFSQAKAYSREYHSGLSDERHNLPSRIQGEEEDFQAKARRLLFKLN